MKLKHVLVIILSFLFLISLSGCFKNDCFIFPEGRFEYNGEPVKFYDDLYIDELYIQLDKITEEVYLNSNNMNVIKNHQNKMAYAMQIKMKYTIEAEAKVYPFEYVGKVPGQNDSYKIILNIDNEEVGIIGKLTLTLYFDSANKSKDHVGSYADRVTAYVRTYEINGVTHNDKFYDFPRDLEFIKYHSV